MPESQSDGGLEDLHGLKAKLKAALNQLPDKTELRHNGRKLIISKYQGGFSVGEHFDDSRLGGAVYSIGPDGTITSYRVMPRDIGRAVGSFAITEDLYTGLLSGLES